MNTVPNGVMSRYEAILKMRNIDVPLYADYRKWLRYYLDFCAKYPVPESKSERIRLFSEKLRDKKQSEQQRQQAVHAVFLYFELQGNDTETCNSEPADTQCSYEPSAQAPYMFRQRQSQYRVAGYQEKSASPEWDTVLEKLAAEIKVRHYSRKTLKTYAHWSRQFQRFLKNKPPQELSTADVKEYLTHLAVKCHVAASTQNQAFNSLLFLFRHALKKDFGDLRDVPRAKKSQYNYRSIDCRLKADRREPCAIIQN
jgi:hypothetical protein